MRTELPVGGGGPNTPSLLSSDRMKIVSHDFQCRSISFFCGPNQAAPSAPGTCARMVPSPGGKYSCSRANRECSGSEPSKHFACPVLIDDGRVEPLTVAGEVTADAMRHLA